MSSFHTCHYCGSWISAEGYSFKGERHWLSDCRPDLTEHEIGLDCTWYKLRFLSNGEYDCYAYRDKDTNKWTNEHKHFYKDGPM